MLIERDIGVGYETALPGRLIAPNVRRRWAPPISNAGST